MPLTSLPEIDSVMAAAGNAILRLLRRDGLRLQILKEAPPGLAAFCVDQNLAFALPDCAVADECINTLCDALDTADPILSHVEDKLGISLEPHNYCAASDSIFADDRTLLLAIDAGPGPVVLAMQPDTDQIERWVMAAEAVPADPAQILIPASLDLIVARLAVDDAAMIAQGDLLLLASIVPAALHMPNGYAEPGFLNLASGDWRVGGYAETEDQMGEDGETQSSEFRVPVSMRLPDQPMDAATLACLAPGAVIPMAPLAAGLVVDLLVGGKRIARGEIVQMAGQFAVHIDESFATTQRSGAVEVHAVHAPAAESSAAEFDAADSGEWEG
jgi:flagellar motor switch/type III secretory pathway protein FliN